MPTVVKASFDLLFSRLDKREPDWSFEKFALYTYGNTIADLFLLSYSEKLWGTQCGKLSPSIAGKRMKGLDLTTFLTEAISGRNAKTAHLDGTFYYPKKGIGMIAEKLGESCGEENILRNSKITKILHDNGRIQAVEVNGKNSIETDEVVSTLPLNHFLGMMEPKPPEEILTLAKSLRYRNLILAALFLDRESVTEDASVYFPEHDFPFTRIYEPKNRSMYMSPPHKTSLVAEIPCQREDELWRLEDDKVIQLVLSRLGQIGWIKEKEVIDAFVGRINNAYPILEIGFEEKVEKIITFLNQFSNLKLSGRSGKFMYTHIHDMMKLGK